MSIPVVLKRLFTPIIIIISYKFSLSTICT